jgi:peptidyl-prolyl cis-trans isomerase SurA
MKKLIKLCAASAFFSLCITHSVSAQPELLDRVAVVIDKGVILESEINDMMKNVKVNSKKNKQTLPSDKALRVQIIEKLIDDNLILQIGERMGIQVSDAMLDKTLNNTAKGEKLTLAQLRKNIIAEGLSYEKYRESVRKDMIIGEVTRNSLRNRIHITPQEITNLLEAMKKQTTNDVEYHLGHILIDFPEEANQEQMQRSKTKADKVIELLNSGSDFAKLAMASSGDTNALNGGDFGWKNINQLPTLFANLIDGKKKGEIFGPIRTGLGYSIVKILDIRGKKIVEVEEVLSSHILIKTSIILSDAKAQSMLQGYYDQISAGEATFSDLAKAHSDDGSGPAGGDLGWSNPSGYVPAFKEALATMKVGDLHKPFRSQFGWHIIKLNGRRMQDTTSAMNENRAYQILYSRKAGIEQAIWIKEKRKEAYIDVFDLGS